MLRSPTPKRYNSPPRNVETVHVIPESMNTTYVADFQDCVEMILGSTLPNEESYEESVVERRLVNDHEDSDERESTDAVSEDIAQILSIRSMTRHLNYRWFQKTSGQYVKLILIVCVVIESLREFPMIQKTHEYRRLDKELHGVPTLRKSLCDSAARI